MSLSPSVWSQTMHCLATRTSLSTQTLHTTWEHGFMTANGQILQATSEGMNLRYIILLLWRLLLHAGQIGTPSSSDLDVPLSLSTGVESDDCDADAAGSNVNFTGTNDFRLKTSWEIVHRYKWYTPTLWSGVDSLLGKLFEPWHPWGSSVNRSKCMWEWAKEAKSQVVCDVMTPPALVRSVLGLPLQLHG